jgi:hypothetical protein
VVHERGYGSAAVPANVSICAVVARARLTLIRRSAGEPPPTVSRLQAARTSASSSAARRLAAARRWHRTLAPVGIGPPGQRLQRCPSAGPATPVSLEVGSAALPVGPGEVERGEAGQRHVLVEHQGGLDATIGEKERPAELG